MSEESRDKERNNIAASGRGTFRAASFPSPPGSGSASPPAFVCFLRWSHPIPSIQPTRIFPTLTSEGTQRNVVVARVSLVSTEPRQDFTYHEVQYVEKWRNPRELVRAQLA
jgi:hypothetical protein